MIDFNEKIYFQMSCLYDGDHFGTFLMENNHENDTKKFQVNISKIILRSNLLVK